MFHFVYVTHADAHQPVDGFSLNITLYLIGVKKIIVTT